MVQRQTIYGQTIYGQTIDDQTRCAHYGTVTDVVAIKFYCCRRYYRVTCVMRNLRGTRQRGGPRRSTIRWH